MEISEIRGLEPPGRRRKECGRSRRPARAERAGASGIIVNYRNFCTTFRFKADRDAPFGLPVAPKRRDGGWTAQAPLRFGPGTHVPGPAPNSQLRASSSCFLYVLHVHRPTTTMPSRDCNALLALNALMALMALCASKRHALCSAAS